MKKIAKALTWIFILIISLSILVILYFRLSRFTDPMIYQTSGATYQQFTSELNHQEFYFDVEKDVRLHGVLFKPRSQSAIATIFHYSGKGIHLNSSVQQSYKPLLAVGFQVFSFERRGFGLSTGEANNSLILKNDALQVFDQIIANEELKNTPVIIWGQSLGGAFATMNAHERQEKIKGVILEGTFSSFTDIGKFYAQALNLQNYRWVVPLLMNNDFPAEDMIKNITLPTVIIHSSKDQQVPYELGKKLFASANKTNTEFWQVDSPHIKAIFNHEHEYVQKFIKILNTSNHKVQQIQ